MQCCSKFAAMEKQTIYSPATRYLIVCEMPANRQPREYMVCMGCKARIWTDRIAQTPRCFNCNGKWARPNFRAELQSCQAAFPTGDCWMVSIQGRNHASIMQIAKFLNRPLPIYVTHGGLFQAWN